MAENKNIKISDTTVKYWTAIFELIDAAGDYSSAAKLYANLMDQTTAWQVQSILDEYYDGKISNLRDRISYCEEQFYAKVNKVNIQCMQNGVMPIKKKKKLLELLLSVNRRRSYRDKATRRLNKNVICPLQNFEKKK